MSTLALTNPASPGYRFRSFVYVFVPFALLVTIANVNAEFGLLGSPGPPAEAGQNPALAKVVYSIWITFVLAIPAYGVFGLFDLRRAPPLIYRYWQLFWAFAYLTYLAHFYYAVGVWFEWDFGQILRRQGWVVTVTNFAITVLWGVDVAVSAIRGQRSEDRAFYRFQWVTHILLVVAMYVSSVKFKSGLVAVLGVILTVVFVLSLLIRSWWGDSSEWCEQSEVSEKTDAVVP